MECFIIKEKNKPQRKHLIILLLQNLGFLFAHKDSRKKT